MSYYSENGGLLYRSYLPGHLRKRSTFRDQLVIPSACIPMVLHACHDHAMSGGHLAYKHTFDKVRDRFWWPTLHRDVKTWCQDCQACNVGRHRTAGPSYLLSSTCRSPISTCFNRSCRIQNGISIPNRTEVLIRANDNRSSHSLFRACRASRQERADHCESSCRTGIWYLWTARDTPFRSRSGV